jgi:hypothetical protein
MTYKEVAQMVDDIGLPFAYDHFPTGQGPDPPFICFYLSGSDDFNADDTNYQKIRPLVLELYTDNKDFPLEETVETALNGAGLVFSREETYIDAERLYMVTFTAEIIITEGEAENG